jgi:hypothetical protein
LAEDVTQIGEKYKEVKEATSKTYKDLTEKAEELEEKVSRMEKCQVESWENIDKNIKHLEQMMERFPEQLTLNEKLVGDMVAKLNAAGKKKCAKGPAVLKDKRFVAQELRRHLARIRKYYPEKTCDIRGNELWLNGRVFQYSEEKKKLVRSKSAIPIEKTVSSKM